MTGLRTVLLVSRHFPPDFAVGGKRAWRFARHLEAFGWRPVVLTAATPRDRPLDASLPLLDASVAVHRTYFPSWYPEEAPRASDGTVAGATRYNPSKLGVWAQLKAATRLPVGKDLWLFARMSRHIADVARSVGADALWVTSSPYTATLFGEAAAAATGLPLILDLRDPWTLNFMASESSWQRKFEQRSERRVLAAADRVVLTCEAASAAYRETYPTLPEAHIRTIYNSFDSELSPTAPPAASENVRIVHFGSCYGPRRLQTVLLAIAMLRDRDGIKSSNFELLNLGRVAAEDLELATELGIADVLQHQPFVPYQQGLETLAGADLLVLLAYGEETLYIPAKLFDYLLVARPILCVAVKSELVDIIERTQTGTWAAPDDVAKVAAELHRVHQAKTAKTSGFRPNSAAVEAFSARNTTAQLAALLDEVFDEAETKSAVASAATRS